MKNILNALTGVYVDTDNIADYLQHIYDAINDIEQIAKSLKVLPLIEPYADNICNNVIIIRANINCIQDIPLKEKF